MATLKRLETPIVSVLLALLLAAVLTAAAGAAEIDHAGQYRACMTLVKRDPEEAFESALAWRDMGGGDAANHCAAAALMGLKQYGEAAKRFENLAQEMKAGAGVKAGLLGHAAQAWLLHGIPKRADEVLGAALEFKPLDVDLMIDRAVVRAALGRYLDAVGDLGQAIGLDSGRPDAFVFRASAYRYLDKLDEAEADANRALSLDPDHPEGLLERGIIRRLKGDNGGARSDWLRVLRETPGTAAAHTAGANLEKMDVKTE